MKFIKLRRRITFLVLGLFFLAVCAFLAGAQQKRTVEEFTSPVAGAPILKTHLQMGTDYAQAEGAVIRSNMKGQVIYAGSDPVLGEKVVIDCFEGWRVVYGGLTNLRVKAGDQVDINKAIGQIGYYPNANEGINRPHLHYEVWQRDATK